jgi:hypothetical protein
LASQDRPVKKNAKIMLYARRKKIRWNDESDDIALNRRMVLNAWPDLITCIDLYYRLNPTMAQYRKKSKPPMNMDCTARFTRSTDKYCITDELKIQVIDALTKLLFRIPSSGLGDVQIKEKTDLWHLRISYSWRVFYRKNENTIQLLELCPHKKPAYLKRL